MPIETDHARCCERAGVERADDRAAKLALERVLIEGLFEGRFRQRVLSEPRPGRHEGGGDLGRRRHALGFLKHGECDRGIGATRGEQAPVDGRRPTRVLWERPKGPIVEPKRPRPITRLRGRRRTLEQFGQIPRRVDGLQSIQGSRATQATSGWRT